MEGAVAARELSADVADAKTRAAEKSAVRFALADRRHDAAIRALLRDNPMRGAIAVSFEREPDYFGGATKDDRTIVALEGDRLRCMGRVSVRERFVNGELRRVGYLGELRLDVSARGRVSIVRGGYRFFCELLCELPPAALFTSIAADNAPAQRLFERHLRGLPRYTLLGEYVTTLVPVPRRSRASAVAEANAETDRGELAEFLNAAGARRQLATKWTPSDFAAGGDDGTAPENFCTVRKRGQLVAAAGLWDQRSWRQTVIRDYAPALRLARPWLNLAARVIGSPRLPAPGTVLAHGFVTPLAAAPGREALVSELLRRLFPAARRRGLELLTVGFAAGDPALEEVRRSFRVREYRSRLYSVSWPEADSPVPPMRWDARLFSPEVAWL